ncbi:hypothetical protein [Janthinobacterium sp. PC23-8]|uniref:hypothetical protein n=1 Tax=Janthinobacterium sp. PC23-8 TaxID=2012679 RepID=UPI000B966FC1|nr:hypothetical protein [Janthinobacterium sp. PC23-8]OYO30585.1 hypothetical protein CD932_05135 [Janthinobacterium sp. PC23-8]
MRSASAGSHTPLKERLSRVCDKRDGIQVDANRFGMCYGGAHEVDAAALQGALSTLPADAFISHVTFEPGSAVFTDHR